MTEQHVPLPGTARSRPRFGRLGPLAGAGRPCRPVFGGVRPIARVTGGHERTRQVTAGQGRSRKVTSSHGRSRKVTEGHGRSRKVTGGHGTGESPRRGGLAARRLRGAEPRPRSWRGRPAECRDTCTPFCRIGKKALVPRTCPCCAHLSRPGRHRRAAANAPGRHARSRARTHAPTRSDTETQRLRRARARKHARTHARTHHTHTALGARPSVPGPPAGRRPLSGICLLSGNYWHLSTLWQLLASVYSLATGGSKGRRAALSRAPFINQAQPLAALLPPGIAGGCGGP